MTNQVQQMYALSIDQAVDLATAIGPQRTVIFQGDMGTGKTTGIKKGLIACHPDHIYVEFDCTNKDIQDLSVPKFMTAVEGMISDYCAFVPNEELGAHLGKKVIINFDEFMKAPEPVKKGVRRIMLERKVNGITLPEGSIIYGTSNKGAEGIGDLLAAHQRNAIIVVQMRKATNMEWIEWGINNNVDHSAKTTRSCLHRSRTSKTLTRTRIYFTHALNVLRSLPLGLRKLRLTCYTNGTCLMTRH